jgi:hypothetical protein
MPRGSKRSYTSKQRRKAHHIEESERKRGRSASRAKQIGYATVNKQEGGGKQSGSGRKGSSSRKGASTSRSRSSSSSSPKSRGRTTASRRSTSRGGKRGRSSR